jgi:hypothetical protein
MAFGERKAMLGSVGAQRRPRPACYQAGSIYGTFGDKEKLFLAVLDR